MVDVIVPRSYIRTKAREAFDAGKARDAHGFNPGAAAIFDWLEEYDRCAAQASQFAGRKITRVDANQVPA